MNSLRCLVLISMLIWGAAQAADVASTDPAARDQAEKRLKLAQERLDQSAREIAALTAQLYEPRPGEGAKLFASSGMSRPILGVNVDELAKSGSEAKAGVRITSVSPGGPADKAGIRANDVLLAVNGKELRGDDKHSPRQQVILAMRDAKADVPLAVQYRRDGKEQTAQVTPKSAGSFEDGFILKGVDGFGSLPMMDGDFAYAFGPRAGKGFGAVEFLNLTPGLGHYFGTDKGLLVVHAPTDERLKLQEGDVVLDIDGRVPSNASHAFRIFSSYRSGEMLKLHIMRDQKHLELPIDVPADTSRLGGLQIDLEGVPPRVMELSKKGTAAGANL